MANNGLEALVRFGVLRLPQLYGSVSRSRDQHILTVDFCIEKLAHPTLVSSRRSQLNALVIFAALNDQFRVHNLLLVKKNLAVCQTHK